MGDENTDTTTTEGRELLDIEVGEVSIVDSPAIRKKFVLTKRAEKNVEDDDTNETVNAPAAAVEEAAAETVQTPAQKQAMPLLTALANERLGAVVEKIAAIQVAVQAGGLTKEDASDMFRGLSGMLWDAQDDVVAISKSLDIPVETDTSKAARRMTTRRQGVLQTVIDNLTTLQTELTQESTVDTETKKTDDAVDESAAPAAPTAADVQAAVTAGITAGLEPVTKRLDGIEAKVNAHEETEVEKAAKAAAEDAPEGNAGIAAIVTAAITKALEPVTQRLDVIESDPGTDESDPETIANDIETVDATVEKAVKIPLDKAAPKGFWGGVLGA